MVRKYKNPSQQSCYNTLLELFADPNSELYLNGTHIQRRGSAMRCAFWDGHNGLLRSAEVVPDTMSEACFQAGKDARRKIGLNKTVTVKLPLTPSPEILRAMAEATFLADGSNLEMERRYNGLLNALGVKQ